VVSHAGARLLADLADATGLTQAFSEALTGYDAGTPATTPPLVVRIDTCLDGARS
jgi:hypothetical protein